MNAAQYDAMRTLVLPEFERQGWRPGIRPTAQEALAIQVLAKAMRARPAPRGTVLDWAAEAVRIVRTSRNVRWQVADYSPSNKPCLCGTPKATHTEAFHGW